MAIKSLSIRIDEDMLDKLHYVADYEGRSANSQILVLIRNCIQRFEEKHGEIEFGSTPSVIAKRRN
ncbi:MAG: Arc family DNA-binding protein [Oscillospiraceae bacterium]|nr:Arc family DNA-binding protein [Oscillospiraceae bacterium]